MTRSQRPIHSISEEISHLLLFRLSGSGLASGAARPLTLDESFAQRRRLRRKKKKPTPPRCARQPLPGEGARVDTPSFLWKEVPRRGGGWMGEAVWCTMLNGLILSITQHLQAIPLRSPLISLRSKWRLTGFSRRFTPKNPVRLHKPFGQLPRWGVKNVLLLLTKSRS